MLFGRCSRIDHPRHTDRVNLVSGLHDFLLQVEENLGEAGLLLGEREDGFVDDLQTESSADALTAGVGDVEADARVGAGLV